MHLLNLNLQRPGAITALAYGSFTGAGKGLSDEFIVARGNTLELLRVERATGKLISVVVTPVFCVVRSLQAFRQVSTTRDYCAVGSDSGKITILEYSEAANELRAVHCETMGKTGCRRIVPGQFLAADPQGRAILIAALEKQKLVYTLNRDAASRLTISSPLEAHKSQAVCYAVVGLDVQFDNPMFGAIELDYADADADPTGAAAAAAEKALVYYQMDLGLNHVTRMWSDPISSTASFLLAVPAGEIGPGGVLVCGENWIAYKHRDHPEVRAALPRRRGTPLARGVLATAGYVHTQHSSKNRIWFAVVQSELGDLYKVTLDAVGLAPAAAVATGRNFDVRDIRVEYFDTVSPATALAVTRQGKLFVAAEYGNHTLFTFTGLGDPADVAVFSSRCDDAELGDDAASAASVAPEFDTRPLRNLAFSDELESLAPVTSMLVADLDGAAAAAGGGGGGGGGGDGRELTVRAAGGGEGAQQVYALCGRGPGSTLRVLRHGLAVTEMARSELPGNPSAVWAVRQREGDPHHTFIVVSFTNATLVLRVDESVVEVHDSGFLLTSATLHVVLLANNSILQIHSTGLRMFKAETTPQEWRTPGKKTVEKAAANSRQVVISQAGGEVTYFELGQVSSNMEEIGTKELGFEVSCLDVGEVPEGRVRSQFLVVGDWTGGVRVFSLDHATMFEQLSFLSLPAVPESLCLVEMLSERGGGTVGGGAAAAGAEAAGASAADAAAAAAAAGQLYLFAGLATGVCQRVAVDANSGVLTDPRIRYLGSKPVKLFPVTVGRRRGVLALSGRSWLAYNYQGRYCMTPLSYDPLEYAADFCTEPCPEGVVAVSSGFLRIFAVDRLGSTFNQQALPLRYTPRQAMQLPGQRPRLVIVEADNEEYTHRERAQLEAGQPVESGGSGATSGGGADGIDVDGKAANGGAPPPPLPAVGNGNGHGGGRVGMDEDEEDEEEDGPLAIPIRGQLPPAPGKWASCVRLVDPTAAGAETLELVELEDDEAALSVTVVQFASRGDEAYVVVGTARRLTFHPLRHEGCFLHVYRVLGNRLVLLHKTEVPAPPLAVSGFQGLLLVGCGRSLRLYDLGKRKLLRKCENKTMPSIVCCLTTVGDRVFAGDSAESLLLVRYRRAENQLAVVADDSLPRMTTRCCALDYDTAAGADKFGNVFVLRAPADAADDLGADYATGTRALWESAAGGSGGGGSAGAGASKLEPLAQFHVGGVVTALRRAALVAGGQEAVLYATVTGAVGALLPFSAREDVDFFTHLEMYMRQEHTTLCGRDHTSYRSYFLPVKGVIDGELCERFGALPPDKQKQVAQGLDRSVPEVLKKLEDVRNRIL